MFISSSVFDLLVICTPNGKPAKAEYYKRAAKAKERIIFSAVKFNPRSLLEKIVTRSFDGGLSQTPPPSTFDTTHPIDLKFGTYNKLHLFFQLSETTWCRIGFHGNNCQINDVTGGRHRGFSNFQILFKFSLLYLRLTVKQYLAVEIHEIGRIHCEVISI